MFKQATSCSRGCWFDLFSPERFFIFLPFVKAVQRHPTAQNTPQLRTPHQQQRLHLLLWSRSKQDTLPVGAGGWTGSSTVSAIPPSQSSLGAAVQGMKNNSEELRIASALAQTYSPTPSSLPTLSSFNTKKICSSCSVMEHLWMLINSPFHHQAALKPNSPLAWGDTRW